METKDHYCLAHFLARNMKAKKRLKIAFIMGNIVPDCNPLTYLSSLGRRSMLGHTYDYRRAYFERWFQKKQKDTISWWYHFGEMIHYLTDSFTAPHNQGFAFGLREHVGYEHRLHEYFVNTLHGGNVWEKEKNMLSGQKSAKWIGKVHDAYLEVPISVQNDWSYIFYTTVSICNSMGKTKNISTDSNPTV